MNTFYDVFTQIANIEYENEYDFSLKKFFSSPKIYSAKAIYELINTYIKSINYFDNLSIDINHKTSYYPGDLTIKGLYLSTYNQLYFIMTNQEIYD